MKYFLRICLLSIIWMSFLVACSVQSAGEILDKTSQPGSLARKGLALTGLVGPKTDPVSWNGITVGRTTLEEVKVLLGDQDKEQIVASDEDTWTLLDYYYYQDNLLEQQYELTVIGLQLAEKSIVAGLQVKYYEGLYSNIPFKNLPRLSTLLEQYGTPDWIFWADYCWIRYVVWEKEGIAAKISIGDWIINRDISPGELKIGSVLYFPQLPIPLVISLDYPPIDSLLAGYYASNPCKDRDTYPMDPFGWSVFSVFTRK